MSSNEEHAKGGMGNNTPTDGTANGQGDLPSKEKDLQHLKQEVDEKVDLLEEKLNKMEGMIDRMEALRRELEICENTLEKLFDNQATKTKEDVTEIVEAGKDQLTGLTEDLLKPHRAVYFAIEDHLKEAAEEVEDLTEKQEERFEDVARASAELKTASEGVEARSEELKNEIEAVRGMRKDLKVEVDKARTTAEILREVAVEEDIERLSEIAEWGIDRMVRRGMEVREEMLEGVENLMAEILNRLDERRKRVSQSLDSGQRFMKQILSEQEAVRVGVEEAEQRIDNEIKELVRETKAITGRRAVLIGAMVFVGMVLAQVFMQLVGLV